MSAPAVDCKVCTIIFEVRDYPTEVCENFFIIIAGKYADYESGRLFCITIPSADAGSSRMHIDRRGLHVKTFQGPAQPAGPSPCVPEACVVGLRCAWVRRCRLLPRCRCSAAVGRGRRCATRCPRSSGSPPRRSITSGPGYNSVLCEQPACCLHDVVLLRHHPRIVSASAVVASAVSSTRMPLLPSSPPSPPWLPQAVQTPPPRVGQCCTRRPKRGVRVGRF